MVIILATSLITTFSNVIKTYWQIEPHRLLDFWYLDIISLLRIFDIHILRFLDHKTHQFSPNHQLINPRSNGRVCNCFTHVYVIMINYYKTRQSISMFVWQRIITMHYLIARLRLISCRSIDIRNARTPQIWLDTKNWYAGVRHAITANNMWIPA